MRRVVAANPPARSARNGSTGATRRAHVRDGVGDSDLVERLEPLGCEPGGEIARDVVEAERGEQDEAAPCRLRPEALVDCPREGQLAARVEVVRAVADRRGHRRVTEL